MRYTCAHTERKDQNTAGNPERSETSKSLARLEKDSLHSLWSGWTANGSTRVLKPPLTVDKYSYRIY